MRKKLFTFLIFSILVAPLLGVVGVHAQAPPCDPITDPTGCAPAGFATTVQTTGGLTTLISNIIKWAQYFFFFLASLMILWSAFDYMTSKGEEAKVKTARDRLVYALVAVAVALVAGGLPRIVAEIVR